MDLILEYIFFIRVSGRNPGYSLYFSVLLSKPCTMHRTTQPFSNLEFEILYLIDFLVPLIDIDTNTLLGLCTRKGQDSSVGRAED